MNYMHYKKEGSTAQLAWCGANTTKTSSVWSEVNCPECLKKDYIDRAIEPLDLINHPPHYAPLPNGIRPIDVTQFYNFNLGNALKYIMRAGKKTEDPAQDLQKAQKYLEFELERIKNHGSQS